LLWHVLLGRLLYGDALLPAVVLVADDHGCSLGGTGIGHTGREAVLGRRTLFGGTTIMGRRRLTDPLFVHAGLALEVGHADWEARFLGGRTFGLTALVRWWGLADELGVLTWRAREVGYADLLTDFLGRWAAGFRIVARLRRWWAILGIVTGLGRRRTAIRTLLAGWGRRETHQLRVHLGAALVIGHADLFAVLGRWWRRPAMGAFAGLWEQLGRRRGLVAVWSFAGRGRLWRRSTVWSFAGRGRLWWRSTDELRMRTWSARIVGHADFFALGLVAVFLANELEVCLGAADDWLRLGRAARGAAFATVCAHQQEYGGRAERGPKHSFSCGGAEVGKLVDEHQGVSPVSGWS